MPKPAKKRYLPFAFDGYYPVGGLGDIVLETNSIPEIERWANNNNRWEYYEILDIETGQSLELVWHNKEARVCR